MRVVYFLVIALVSFSCMKDGKESSSEPPKGGVAFTFDDGFTQEWNAHSYLFERYGIKATFCISNTGSFDEAQFSALKLLFDSGHEIACHSLTHKSVKEYSGKPQQYISVEVDPVIQTLSLYDIPVFSYAYPFGHSDPDVDSLLLDRFQFVRKATYNRLDTTISTYDSIYATVDNHAFVNAIGIDCSSGISFENFKLGLQRAIEKNEILVVYAHNITTSGERFTIRPSYLDSIFQIVEELDAATYRLKDIKPHFN